MSDLCTIRAAELSLEDVLELACNHVLAKRRQAIDKHGALQVVELVLHDAGQIGRASCRERV